MKQWISCFVISPGRHKNYHQSVNYEMALTACKIFVTFVCTVYLYVRYLIILKIMFVYYIP